MIVNGALDSGIPLFKVGAIADLLTKKNVLRTGPACIDIKEMTDQGRLINDKTRALMNWLCV